MTSEIGAAGVHSGTGTIRNTRGLHARASATFVRLAETFDAEITVSRDGQSVPGTSIVGLLTLGAALGCKIDVAARGPQAEQALAAILDLIECGFNEDTGSSLDDQG